MTEDATDRLLASAFATAHVEDVARLVESLGVESIAEVLEALPDDVAGAVVAKLVPTRAVAALGHLEPTRAAGLAAAAGPVATAAILRRATPELREAVQPRLTARDRAAVERLLENLPGTAGAVMDPLAPVVAADSTVSVARSELVAQEVATMSYVYAVSRDGKLQRVLRVSDLLRAPLDELVRALPEASLETVLPSASLETVVSHGAWERQDALPVVDQGGKFLGAIRHSVARRISRDLGTTARRPEATETAAALAEFYGLGLSGIGDWLVSLVHAPRGTRN